MEDSWRAVDCDAGVLALSDEQGADSCCGFVFSAPARSKHGWTAGGVCGFLPDYGGGAAPVRGAAVSMAAESKRHYEGLFAG